MDTEHRHLHDDLGMFEAATKAAPVHLSPPELKQIVAIQDGSNQDETVAALAAVLAKQTGAKVHTEQKKEAIAADIKKLCEDRKADVLVTPAPFGRDIEVLKDESLGSVIDMLLQELSCAVLCARQPMTPEEVERAFANLLIPVLDLDKGHEKAVNWAIRVVSPKGEVELLGVADEEKLKEAKQLFAGMVDTSAFQVEALNHAVTRDIGGMVAALQKYGSENDLKVHVEVKNGQPIPLAVEHANREPRLTVVFTPHEHTTTSHHHAVDLVLGAKGPVLVV